VITRQDLDWGAPHGARIRREKGKRAGTDIDAAALRVRLRSRSRRSEPLYVDVKPCDEQITDARRIGAEIEVLFNCLAMSCGQHPRNDERRVGSAR